MKAAKRRSSPQTKSKQLVPMKAFKRISIPPRKMKEKKPKKTTVASDLDSHSNDYHEGEEEEEEKANTDKEKNVDDPDDGEVGNTNDNRSENEYEVHGTLIWDNGVELVFLKTSSNNHSNLRQPQSRIHA
jgi:hypothetical protein